MIASRNIKIVKMAQQKSSEQNNIDGTNLLTDGIPDQTNTVINTNILELNQHTNSTSLSDDDIIQCAVSVENQLLSIVDNFDISNVDQTSVSKNTRTPSRENSDCISSDHLTYDSVSKELPIENEERILSQEEEEEESPYAVSDNSESAEILEEEHTLIDNQMGNDELQDIPTRVRKKRRHVNKEKWHVNQQKINRSKGEEYKGLIKENGKWTFNKKQSARRLKPSCLCAQSTRNSKLHCNLITDKARQTIFKSFWSKSWPEKRQYVKNLVDLEPVKQRKTDSAVSRRQNSLYFFLKTPEGTRVRVCKKQFLNTLCIGEWSVL